MQIKYKIIELNPVDHQIVVRYFTDVVPPEPSQIDADGNVLRCRTDVAITLPVPTPTGAELENVILRCCPRGFFETRAAVLDPNIDTSLDTILPLVNAEMTATLPSADAPSATVADLVTVQVS